jgi:hypothetical protein
MVIAPGRRRPLLLARTAAVSVLAALATVCWPAAEARAADPPFIGWSAALPGINWSYEPTSSDDCAAGRISCVDKTIRQMQRSFDPLAATCSHSAVFALAYLRTTEAYRSTAVTPGFYADPAFVNHEEAAFAATYFSAYGDWTDGRIERVPPAWRIAFRAAENREVSGTGDLLLGINAHVNRDLPFVLAAIGTTAPDGSSRKPDHDAINKMLNRVIQPLVAEQAARFDPDIALLPTPYGIGYAGLLQMLVAWRESAWRHAEQLVQAPTPAARSVVAETIEQDAAANAAAIVASTRYVSPVTTTASRDRYCAARRDGAS